MPYIIPSYYQAFDICRKSMVVFPYLDMSCHTNPLFLVDYSVRYCERQYHALSDI